MTTSHASTEQRMPGKRIWLTGLIAAAISTIVNVALALALSATLDISDEFAPLQPFAVVLNTVVATLLGTAVYQLISRLAKRPLRVFTIVVAVVLVLSAGLPLTLLAIESSPYYPGLTDAGALALLPLHLPPAIVLLSLLGRQARF